jgi:hypothetical protein
MAMTRPLVTRRDLFRGALASLGARLLPAAVLGGSLASIVARGPSDRAWSLLQRFGATLYQQPGLDYARRTGFAGYFTDKTGRAVGWLGVDGRVWRTVPGPVRQYDARGYELPLREIGRAW